MTHPLADELATHNSVSVAQVTEGIHFVLGRDLNDDEVVSPAETDQLRAFFSAVSPYVMDQQNPDANETIVGLTVKSWRQFDHVELDLHSQLTILTGENGTGKTSLLALLSQALGMSAQFLGTPTRDESGFSFRQGRRKATGEFQTFGIMKFSSGAGSQVGTREWQGSTEPSFSPELVPYRTLPGLYLDATRIIGPYQRLESIPPKFLSAREIADAYAAQLRNMFIPHQLVKSPALMIKEALVAAAIFGEGNSMMVGDPIAKQVWTGFQEILTEVFPPSLGFEGLLVDQGEVIIRTHGGQFALEAASGGIAALVTLTWQIYLHQFDSPQAFTVCFDEPENHLHPSLQRSLLPALLRAFPNVKFVVATHSPFIVTSIKSATIHALRRNDSGLVYSTQIDLANQAATADEVLSEILGVGVTVPIWAENELEAVLTKLRVAASPEDVARAMDQLENAGLRISSPDVARALAETITDALDEGAR